MQMGRSKKLYERAKKVLVGGVNSPVRAMKPYPFFTKHAKGSKIYDVDGNEYIDYCLAYGPLILGHAHDYVVGKIKEQAERGTAYGTPTEQEVILAEKVVKHVPSAEMVRFVNSGTEATMSAIRLARGYTGRRKIIKIEGAFHGAHDYVLVKAGSGATTHGVPTSAGIPEDTTKNTILVPFNDEEAVESVVKREREDIACIILEPIMGNAGLILPKDGYLKFLREITEENGILLIFDEVITGFRVSMGGAQEYYGVEPDITTLGKVLGGGLPIGAIAGKREIMENFSPLGKVYQAGTFNGNPMSMTSGIATLEVLERENVHEKINSLGEKIAKELRSITDYYVSNIGSMFQIFFTEEEVYDYATAQRSNAEKFLEFQRALLSEGIFLPPSQFETNFISYAHTKEDVEKTIAAMENALRKVSGK